MIGKIWKNSKLNSEKIWKNMEEKSVQKWKDMEIMEER
jgi:hypothetical protein